MNKEQVKQVDELRERLSNLESFDSRKCRKGHSYRETYGQTDAGAYKTHWRCIKCEREM